MITHSLNYLFVVFSLIWSLNCGQLQKNMSSNTQSPQNSQQKEVLRKELLDLNAQRSKLENDIKEWQSILRSQNVGMNEPLVDANGFPRNDIDVHQIRMARNKIICLTNDARNLMKQIEEKLFKFHELEKQKQQNEDNPQKWHFVNNPLLNRLLH